MNTTELKLSKVAVELKGEAKASYIKLLRADGWTLAQIAQAFGISGSRAWELSKTVTDEDAAAWYATAHNSKLSLPKKPAKKGKSTVTEMIVVEVAEAPQLIAVAS